MKWVSDDDDDFGDGDDYVLFYGISDSERTAGVFFSFISVSGVFTVVKPESY